MCFFYLDLMINKYQKDVENGDLKKNWRWKGDDCRKRGVKDINVYRLSLIKKKLKKNIN